MREFAGYLGQFLPDNKVAISGSGRTTVSDLDKADCVLEFDSPGEIWNATLSPEGSRLLVYLPNRVQVYDVARGRELFGLAWNQQEAFSFSRDGKLLLRTQKNGPLQAVNVTTGEDAPLPPIYQAVEKRDGSPIRSRWADERRLFYRDEDQVVALDAASGAPVAKLAVGTGGGVASADGRRLLSRHGTHGVRVWGVDTGKVVASSSVPKDVDLGRNHDWGLSADGRLAVLAVHPDLLLAYRLPDPARGPDQR